MWRGAGEDGHFAARLDFDGGTLPAAGRSCGRGTEGADFAVSRNTNSHEASLRLSVTLCVSQLVVIHHIQRFLQGRGVVAAVVTQPGSRQVRKLVFAGEVLQAQLGGIHFELDREQIHHALDAVGGLGAPGSAISVSGNAVGKDAHDVRDHIAEFIKPGHHQH